MTSKLKNSLALAQLIFALNFMINCCAFATNNSNSASFSSYEAESINLENDSFNAGLANCKVTQLTALNKLRDTYSAQIKSANDKIKDLSKKIGFSINQHVAYKNYKYNPEQLAEPEHKIYAYNERVIQLGSRVIMIKSMLDQINDPQKYSTMNNKDVNGFYQDQLCFFT